MEKRTKPGFGAAEAELRKRQIKWNERKIKEKQAQGSICNERGARVQCVRPPGAEYFELKPVGAEYFEHVPNYFFPQLRRAST